MKNFAFLQKENIEYNLLKLLIGKGFQVIYKVNDSQIHSTYYLLYFLKFGPTTISLFIYVLLLLVVPKENVLSVVSWVSFLLIPSILVGIFLSKQVLLKLSSLNMNRVYPFNPYQKANIYVPDLIDLEHNDEFQYYALFEGTTAYIDIKTNVVYLVLENNNEQEVVVYGILPK